ncbi:hypothetical protein B0J17DRAFT_598442 [Rhizoctonia solani]|nr:hypothetical protein B0J17DRAFT_598442 [Rhizoctonia solani]
MEAQRKVLHLLIRFHGTPEDSLCRSILHPTTFAQSRPRRSCISVGKLWGFSDLCDCLLPLVEKALCDIDKIILARELGIENWLSPAHIRLCQRREQLTAEEARKLGIDSVLLITRMREQNVSKDKRRLSAGYYCASCSGFSSSGGSSNPYNSVTCKGCQASVYSFVHYNGGGAIMTDPGTRNSAFLEAEVKKWVQGGCMFKD